MTACAFLPAQLIYVAAQFAARDSVKGALTGVRVRPAGESGIIIDSCDGHRAFRVTCPDPNWSCSEPLLIDAKTFRKRIPQARHIVINPDVSGEARIMGGPGLSEYMYSVLYGVKDHQGIPCTVSSFPDCDQLWPDRFTGSAAPIHFNAELLKTFLTEVSRYSWNGTLAMECNTPTTALKFTSEIDDPSARLANVMMEFLLMPVQARSRQAD
jgi:hypothetical protein